MKMHGMQLKIISYILIQTFIALEFCWAGPAVTTANESTLAPAMAINKIDIQSTFSLIPDLIEEELSEDLSWGYLEVDQEADAEAAMSRTAIPVTTAEAVSTSSSTLSNIASIEPVQPPPPPKSTLGNIFSTAALRNTLAFYPFNKKNLEDKLKSYGFEVISPEIDRKLLAYLLETLEVHHGEFIEILNKLDVKRIGYKSVITQETHVRSLDIESGILYLTPEFLEQRLAVRVSLLNDEIAGLSDISDMIEFIDYDGEVKMATSKDLGLSESADDMLREMKKIAAEYTKEPYWYGFKSFIPYKTDDPGEFMRLIRIKNSTTYEYLPDRIGISLLILPKFVRLYEEAPKLWKELFEAALAHEGGRKGHLMRWPLTNIAEIIQIFNWPKLVQKTAESIIKNFVNEIWSYEIIERGTPPLEKWMPAIAVINLGLKHFNITTPVIWKEYEANYGMVQERGLRAVAIWFWWLDDFLGVKVHFNKDRDQLFTFLSDEEWAKVFELKKEMQQEYKNNIGKEASATVKSYMNQIFTSVAIGLLSYFGFAQDLFAGDGTFQAANILSIDWGLVIAGVAILAGLSKILNRENTILRKFRKAINPRKKYGLVSFLNYFDQSKPQDQIMIISALLDAAMKRNDRLIGPEDIENILIAGLRENEETRVRSFTLKAIEVFSKAGYGSLPFVNKLQEYAFDKNNNVAEGVTRALSNYGLRYSPNKEGDDWKFRIDSALVKDKFENSRRLVNFGLQQKAVKNRSNVIIKKFRKAVNTDKKQSLSEFIDFFNHSVPKYQILIIDALMDTAMKRNDKIIHPEHIAEVLLAGLDEDNDIRVRISAARSIQRFSDAGYGSSSFAKNLEQYAHDKKSIWVAISITRALENYGLRYSSNEEGEDWKFRIDNSLVKEKQERSKRFANSRLQQKTAETKPRRKFSPIKQWLSSFSSLTTEAQTIKLVNQAIKTKQTGDLADFYKNSSIADKVTIINTAARHILEDREKIDPKVNPELFEMFFADVLYESPENVINAIQKKLLSNIELKGREQITPAVKIMNSVILPALDFYRKYYGDKIDINAVSLELSQLVVDLAVANSLHEEFISAVNANKILSEYIKSYNQASNLYRSILKALSRSSLSPRDLDICEEIIKKELRKINSGINAARVARELTPHLNSLLAVDKPMMFALSETLSQSSIKGLITKKEAAEFFANVHKELVNNTALRLAFPGSYIIIKTEVEKLNLNINSEETSLTIFPNRIRAALLNSDEGEYSKLKADAEHEKFYAALEEKTSELRFASMSVLENFFQQGIGSGRLVSHLQGIKEFLRKEGTGISMDLIDKITIMTEGSSQKKNIKSKKKKQPSTVTAPKLKVDKPEFQHLFLINSAI